MSASYYNPDNLSQAQLWGLGLSAVLTQLNAARHDRLHGSGTDRDAILDIKHTLKHYWSIENRKDLLDTLDWLSGQGHHTAFEQWQQIFQLKSERRIKAFLASHTDKVNLALVNNYYRSLNGVGIRAWDDGRYVSLCRWGATAGYLTEPEAWDHILRLARSVQTTFSSWHNFALSYLAGKQYWQDQLGEDFVVREMELVKVLLSDDDSPWVKLPWNTDLTRQQDQS